MKRNRMGKSLFFKFVLAILLLGILPMILLSMIFFQQIFQKYRQSLALNYAQAAQYINAGIENAFESFSSISKTIYQCDFLEHTDIEYNRYDNLRKMINGEGYAEETKDTERSRDMEAFLKNSVKADEDIYAAHFIGYTEDGEQVTAHFSAYSRYFRSEDNFLKSVDYENWDEENSQAILIPPHKEEYFGSRRGIFTVGRNYFDIRGEIGEKSYVGTIFLDIDVRCIENLVWSLDFKNGEKIFLFDEKGNCFYSNDKALDQENQRETDVLEQAGENQLILETAESAFGLRTVILVDETIAFSQINLLRAVIYGFWAAAVLVLFLSAVYFSKRMTGPVYDMMEQMSKIETGNFDFRLEVNSRDEIGVLAQRFNRMSGELKRYINKSYVAQVKQKEAELTALKSQIYPHFLYNTLEIIRMTALERQDETVAQMIEALAQQIRYLMGPMDDVVPLEKEVQIIRQYIRLLNFRIHGKVTLNAVPGKESQILVPKLILQPVVENAYVHGIKPKNQTGSIQIEVSGQERGFEISVLDNGVGIAPEELADIEKLLAGEEMGSKTGYDWQSVGLKNVHDRIRHLYGEEYGLHITSTVGIGTMVSILIPKIEKDSEAGNDKNDHSGR